MFHTDDLSLPILSGQSNHNSAELNHIVLLKSWRSKKVAQIPIQSWVFPHFRSPEDSRMQFGPKREGGLIALLRLHFPFSLSSFSSVFPITLSSTESILVSFVARSGNLMKGGWERREDGVGGKRATFLALSAGEMRRLRERRRAGVSRIRGPSSPHWNKIQVYDSHTCSMKLI